MLCQYVTVHSYVLKCVHFKVTTILHFLYAPINNYFYLIIFTILCDDDVLFVYVIMLLIEGHMVE